MIPAPPPPPIQLDRNAFTGELIHLVHRERAPVVLSEMLVKLWCGTHRLSEEMTLLLRDNGVDTHPGTDHRGGWCFRRAEDAVPEGALF